MGDKNVSIEELLAEHQRTFAKLNAALARIAELEDELDLDRDDDIIPKEWMGS